jgi:hypothetical protein
MNRPRQIVVEARRDGNAGFMVVLVCLATLCGGALHAAGPAGVDAQTVHRNAQELWRSNIGAPQATTASSELDQMATQVQAISDAAQRPKTADPSAQGQPAPGATWAGESNAPAATAQTQPAGPPPLDANTIERLKLAPPSGPVGKIVLADSLFAQDQFEGAAALYKEALAQDKSGRDRDWALFQIGNCLRTKDPSAARGFYLRVSAECPGSSWAMIAATECQYLDRQQEPTTRPAAARGANEARGAGARSTPLTAGPSTPPAAGRAIAAAPTGDANAR